MRRSGIELTAFESQVQRSHRVTHWASFNIAGWTFAQAGTTDVSGPIIRSPDVRSTWWTTRTADRWRRSRHCPTVVTWSAEVISVTWSSGRSRILVPRASRDRCTWPVTSYSRSTRRRWRASRREGPTANASLRAPTDLASSGTSSEQPHVSLPRPRKYWGQKAWAGTGKRAEGSGPLPRIGSEGSTAGNFFKMFGQNPAFWFVLVCVEYPQYSIRHFGLKRSTICAQVVYFDEA